MSTFHSSRPPVVPAAVASPLHARVRREEGAVSAEYAAVTAVGVGLGGVLIKLLTSDFGQQLLKMILDFFLGMVGVA